MPHGFRAGFPTRWQVWGQADPALLMLHCSLASSDAWRAVAGQLQDAFTMTAFDFPGHGQSGDWNGDGDYHTLCTSIASSFLERPMHLIGHSFGATVALRMACEHPTRVKSLTLIEPVLFAAAKGTDAYCRHEIEFRPFMQALEAGNKKKAARHFTAQWGTGAAWETLPQATRHYLSERISLIPAAAMALYGDNAGVLDDGRLEALSCPVLFIQGAQSPEIVGAIIRGLAQRISKVEHTTVPAASHMLPITHPLDVARRVRCFISA